MDVDVVNMCMLYLGEPSIVPVDGGRYDVLVDDRQRNSVYWKENPCEVSRCSWFYRDDSNMKYVPYSEELSEELEVCLSQLMTEHYGVLYSCVYKNLILS